MSTYRILCLDGGGVRGILTVVILQRIEQENPSWLNKVDLICGVSSGGIIGLALANGMKAVQINEFMKNTFPKILDRNWTL